MVDSKFNPTELEAKWCYQWEHAGYFSPSNSGEPYCIMIPPPNVTGSLHMGHAFQQTLMDVLIRYHRMQGHNTLWLVGTDHAGIATQMVVERQLEATGATRHSLGREAFIEKIWNWKAESGGNITRQLRRLGASVDWTRERFTLEPGLSLAVQTVFIKLFEEGLIYRGKRLVNWDPVLQTAVSDLEVESSDESGFMWHINYPLRSGLGVLTVATTRPETLLGDVAVAVHPDDERYKHLIGQMLSLPLCDREIPIIGDTYVEPGFGTGCVKITPAHDFNDFEMGKRHNLPSINIFDKTATLNENAPPRYQGQDRFVARKNIVADLEQLGLLHKVEPHNLQVPRGDKSGAIIEPLLTDQWFVKIEPLAKAAIQAVENGDIKFVPENWSKTYFEWMHNIQDWCISRQLWWGHRIPAWYDENQQIYVGETEALVRIKYALSDDIQLTQDDDVLDTWFSSALWPFSTLGWPKENRDMDTFYPTNVLVTGFDIIFFWVARMIMFGLKFTHKVPFHTVYIHGLIQDSDGQKMSKSKGNVIDPIDLIDGIDIESLVKKRTQGLMQPQKAKAIEKATRAQFKDGIPAFGCDALRFTYCALATHARHVRFDLKRIEGYRNFCNKIWNATRFVLMHATDKYIPCDLQPNALSLTNAWIFSIWQDTKQSIIQHLQTYRFDLAALVIYEFIWNEYCDWCLEFAKPAFNNLDTKTQAVQETLHSLVTILEELLRVIHPFMPFISEELWQKVAPLCQKTSNSIMLQPYPQYDKAFINEAAVQGVEWLKKITLSIRTIRGEMNLAPSLVLPVMIYNASITEQALINENKALLQLLAKINPITFLDTDTKDTHYAIKEGLMPGCATAVVGDMEILIPLQGLINIEAERNRLSKEIAKLSKELEIVNSRLANSNYVEKAPPEVVEKERARAHELQTTVKKLELSLQSLG